MNTIPSILRTLFLQAALACLPLSSTAQPTSDPPVDRVTNEPAPAPTPAPPPPPAPASPSQPTNTVPINNSHGIKTWSNPQPIVLFGQNETLEAGESAETVVVIGGSATIHGRVRQAVVVIGGDAEVDGDVGQAVVAILGDVHLKPGAEIEQDVVSVLGTVSADSGTHVGGNAVAVGGRLNIADGADVNGNKVNVGIPGPFSDIHWLRDWLKYCVFELRPLAFQVKFVWVIGAVFLLIYLLIAAVFHHPVQASVTELDRRPAIIFLVGLLVKLLLPFVYLILAATGVGVFVIPLVGVTCLIFALFGKVAILEWLGFKLGRLVNKGFQQPLLALLLGTLLMVLLYLVPVVGLLAYVVFGIWALGSGVMAVFGHNRRETPPPSTPPLTPAAPVAQPAAQTESIAPPPVISDNPPPQNTGASMGFAPGTTGAPPDPAQPQAAPATPSVPLDWLSYPRANLWERVLAAILDIILIGIVSSVMHLGSYCLIIALAYFAAMWTWRGTTIGGIVLKLKVVRSDGRPLTFMVALVRGLAAAFSVAVLLLGYLWIAWDKDKQGWHDKIAGTEVIRLPRSVSLVCL